MNLFNVNFIYITQSKSKTQKQEVCNVIFICITFNFDKTQHSIKLTVTLCYCVEHQSKVYTWVNDEQSFNVTICMQLRLLIAALDAEYV